MIFPDPKFEWDEAKSNRNRATRGFGFDEAAVIFAGEVSVTEDSRRDYGEERVIATGMADGSLIIVRFTFRSDRIRIISARISKRRERDAYRKAYPARDS